MIQSTAECKSVYQYTRAVYLLMHHSTPPWCKTGMIGSLAVTAFWPSQDSPRDSSCSLIYNEWTLHVCLYFTNSLKYWTKNNIQRSCRPWKLMFWWHATLWIAKRHREPSVANEHSPLTSWRRATLQWSVTQSFFTSDMHSAWRCTSQHS